ncbi:hypothetical protein [Sphingomonas sp. S2-65]|uniref:hypothetical protein n=1 Tax=Sphingomonas sp. S2-65 TaxID=2903960 RepID=UPI001F232D08|nr:hypothetical protein [Sphingomonas sp. S2-65]UYY58030.1 hypothetical protein LZ586_15400 [Sphingomonas sp. S2-65]
MGYWDIGLRHIVDVDGQLLAIDDETIEAIDLLARANRPTGSQLWLLLDGERVPIGPEQRLSLSEDEVLFFETSDRASGAGCLLAA